MNTKFQTRQDYEEAFEALIRPLPKYYSEGKARMMPGCTGVSYGEYTAGWKAFPAYSGGLFPTGRAGRTAASMTLCSKVSQTVRTRPIRNTGEHITACIRRMWKWLRLPTAFF